DDEAVNIVGKEHHKADDHRKIGRILQHSQTPQQDEHQIVGGIGHRKQRAAPGGKVDGQKTGGDGQRAGQQVGGAEGSQDEIEYYRDHDAEDHGKNTLPAGAAAY